MSYLLDDLEKTAAQEEMSEKERHGQEIAKLKRRRLLSGLAFAGGAGTDLGINIANEMDRGNPKIKRNIKRVNYPATLLATYGLVDSNLKLKRERQKYHDSLKGTEKTASEPNPKSKKEYDKERRKLAKKLKWSLATTAAGAALKFGSKPLARNVKGITPDRIRQLSTEELEKLKLPIKAANIATMAGVPVALTGLSQVADNSYKMIRLKQQFGNKFNN